MRSFCYLLILFIVPPFSFIVPYHVLLRAHCVFEFLLPLGRENFGHVTVTALFSIYGWFLVLVFLSFVLSRYPPLS